MQDRGYGLLRIYLIGSSATPIAVAVRVDYLVSAFVAQIGALLLPYCCHDPVLVRRGLSLFLHFAAVL